MNMRIAGILTPVVAALALVLTSPACGPRPDPAKPPASPDLETPATPSSPEPPEAPSIAPPEPPLSPTSPESPKG
jgi:hypothetical protein